MQPSGPVPEGIRFVIERSTTDLRLWGQSTKLNPILLSENERGLTSGGTAWVEWATEGTGPGGSNLTLGVWDTTHNRRVLTDTIHFYPFTSVIIALGGENQVPADPTNDPGNQGVFDLAIELYRDGYDVHMYDEDAVDDQGADHLPEGRPNNEVLSALRQRGVTQVAVYGYSHGGGSTYLMVDRLHTQEGIHVNFTAYIDGVEDDSGHSDMSQETRRPTESAFHANYYQHGTMGDGWLDGGPIGDPQAGDFEIDVETEPAGNPWYPNATHGTIDDPRWYINEEWIPGQVYVDLGQRLRTRITR